MDYNRRLNYTSVTNVQDSSYTDEGRQFFRSLSPFDTSSEHKLLGHGIDYDEIDLLSECSTPVSYVPGRYLQLCGISLDVDRDTKLWPVSNGPSVTDGNTNVLLSGTTRHVNDEEYLFPQTYRKTTGLRQNNSRLLITIVICVVVALTALGGLATFV